MSPFRPASSCTPVRTRRSTPRCSASMPAGPIPARLSRASALPIARPTTPRPASSRPSSVSIIATLSSTSPTPPPAPRSRTASARWTSPVSSTTSMTTVLCTSPTGRRHPTTHRSAHRPRRRCSPIALAIVRNDATPAQPDGPGWFLTEFGATTDASDLTRMVADADANLVGWMYWQWLFYEDPTGSHDSGLWPAGPATSAQLDALSETVRPGDRRDPHLHDLRPVDGGLLSHL